MTVNTYTTDFEFVLLLCCVSLFFCMTFISLIFYHQGYRQKGAYIATQGPLQHTVTDFWRMVWEQECRCIVMLCKSEENGEVKFMRSVL